MIGDLSSLIGDITPTTVTVRTFGAPTINAFGESSSPSSDATLTAVVHPSGRRELSRAGLDAQRETIAVYSSTALGGSTSARPPQIQYAGRWYEVVRVADYLALGGVCLIHAALIEDAAS